MQNLIVASVNKDEGHKKICLHICLTIISNSVYIGTFLATLPKKFQNTIYGKSLKHYSWKINP
jgi:hypothetical protein